MGRPQTRRKKVVVSSSESSDGGPQKQNPKPQHLETSSSRQKKTLAIRSTPGKLGHISIRPAKPVSQSPTPDSTPKKPQRRAVKERRNDEKGTQTLHSFFNAATENKQTLTLGSLNGAGEKENEPVEAIEDDFSDYDQKPARATYRTTSGETFRKRSWNIANGEQPNTSSVLANQKFIKTNDRKRAPTPQPASTQQPRKVDTRPWTEKYAPIDLGEVAVHHKKVADVRSVLDSALQSKSHHRLIVLKGPAGAGKTATVSLLSKALQCDIIEWGNPTTPRVGSDDYVSVSAQFEDFIAHAGTFGSLQITGIDEDAPAQESTQEVRKSDRTIMLLEEFPSIFGRASTGLQNFRSQVLQYLAANITSGLSSSQNPLGNRRSTCLVMIISESFVSNSSFHNNFTAHRILGPEILSHPGTAMVEFNPVARTFITKALNQTLQKHSRELDTVHAPQPLVMQKLADMGDLRNAISTLEFLCSDTTSTTTASTLPTARSNPRTAKRSSKPFTQAPTAEETTAISLIATRESTLGLFHAVGKVLYNKRLSPDPTSPLNTTNSPLPPEQQNQNPLPDFDLDILLDSTGTDTSNFLSALHENYPLSTFSPNGDSEATLDSLVSSTASLSTADTLGNFSSSERKRGGNYATAGEDLRQEELASHAAVRGIMHALPWPVKRQPPSSAMGGVGKNEAFRMFFPADVKLWRWRVEMRDTIEFLALKALGGELFSKASATTTGYGTFSKREVDREGCRYWSGGNESRDLEGGQEEDSNYISIASGQSARRVMALERLPTLVKLLASTRRAFTSHYVKDIERVTHFTGIGVVQEDEFDDEITDAGAPASSDSRQGRGMHGLAFKRGYPLALTEKGQSVQLEKLVLSDDDIEDD